MKPLSTVTHTRAHTTSTCQGVCCQWLQCRVKGRNDNTNDNEFSVLFLYFSKKNKKKTHFWGFCVQGRGSCHVSEGSKFSGVYRISGRLGIELSSQETAEPHTEALERTAPQGRAGVWRLPGLTTREIPVALLQQMCKFSFPSTHTL